jgi:hypothetical protein
MKLTKSKLKQIIKEELNKVLKEDGDWAADSPMAQAKAAHCGKALQKYADYDQLADENFRRDYPDIRAGRWYDEELEKLKAKYPNCDFENLPEPTSKAKTRNPRRKSAF